MDISNFPTSYYNLCRRDLWNVVCVVYDATSGKSSLWVNHGKIRDFACRLPLRGSTLSLFYRVVYFDESSGFNGYIESVEMYNYYKYIPTGLIAARMTYLCEKFKIPKRAGTMIKPLGSQASSEDDAMFIGKIGVMEVNMGKDEDAPTSIKKAIVKILCRDYNVQFDA